MARKVSSLTDYGKISNALLGGKRGRRMSKGRDCVNKGKDPGKSRTSPGSGCILARAGREFRCKDWV